MYDTGSYQDYDKEFAGLYTQVTARNAIDYATPYGGVAIPVSLISTAPSVPRPDQAIAVPRGQKDYIMSQYTFAQSSLVSAMVDEAQRNASTVYLCPYDGVNKQPTTQAWIIPRNLTFGKGKKSSVELWEYNHEQPDQPTPYFEYRQGARIKLTGDGNIIKVQLITPDGVEVFRFDTGQPVNYAIVPNAVNTEGTIIDSLGKEKYNQTEQTATYRTNSRAYGQNLNIKVYVNEVFTNGEVDEYILMGGSDRYDILANLTNQAVVDGDVLRGCYAACSFDLIDAGGMSGNLLRRTQTSDAAYAFIKNTVGYVGSHSGYYADIQNGTVTLYYQDYAHNVYPAPKPIVVDSADYDQADPIAFILLRMSSIHIAQGNRFKDTAWAQTIPADGRLIIGFSPIYPRLNHEERFERFCDQAGRTSTDIMMYPYWSDDINGQVEPREAKIEHYQKVQKWYLDRREKLCSLTQLLMDESLYKYAREWRTDEPMTMNNPYLISLKSGKGNKRDSQLITAYTAGVLTSCSAYKSATGHIYHGGATVKLYEQTEIKNMHLNGVMTYHLQDGQTEIYIDRSAYVKKTADAATNIFEKVYERNKTIRTINLFTYAASRMFFQHYFNKALEGSIPLMIQGDIMNILVQMSKSGAVEPPDGDDVSVKSIDPESYGAVVQMQIKGTPEKLYVKIGV